MELSPARGAHFQKMSVLVSEAILDEFWMENEPKKRSQFHIQINEKIDAFMVKTNSVF